MSAATITVDPVARVLAQLERVCQSGPNQWSARCPAHGDRNPSLSISVGGDGRALVYCHAGCSTDEVIAAIGLAPRDLFADDERRGEGNSVREWQDCDEH